MHGRMEETRGRWAQSAVRIKVVFSLTPRTLSVPKIKELIFYSYDPDCRKKGKIDKEVIRAKVDVT